MSDDNGQVPVLNPAETEAWIRHISNRIAKGVKVTTGAEADMKAKKRAFDLAYAYAYKRAEGSEQFRRQTAVIESMPHREEADNAEIAYRYAQRTAEALERELFAAMAVNRNIVSMFGAAGGGVVTAPYWADGQVSLYLGDCREVTDWLSADVLVTDPPYGRSQCGGALPNGGSARKRIAGDGDLGVRDDAVKLWGDRIAVIFGDPVLAPPAGARQVLVATRPPNAGWLGARGGFRRDLEFAYLAGPWPVDAPMRSSLISTSTRSLNATAKRYGHQNAKPVDVMETLIAACPPGVVADPFTGSGSTLVAARNQGRAAVGVEIDERYCELAARRLDQGVLAMDGAS